MPRDAHVDAIAASQEPLIRPILMASFDYETGVLRLHSAVGTLSWNGEDWLGIGSLGKITGITEEIELAASGIKAALSGVDTTNISRTLGENYQGRPGIVYIALLDTDHQLIGEPVVLFQGRMDTHVVTLGAEGSISVTIENLLRDWDRPRERRYNNDDQQSRWPGDKGMEFVEQAAQKEVFWGRATPKE